MLPFLEGLICLGVNQVVLVLKATLYECYFECGPDIFSTHAITRKERSP